MTFRPSSIRFSRSVLFSVALGAASLGAVACGGGASSGSSASPAAGATAVTLSGTYAADASDAAAPYASLTFLKSGAFFGYRQGCAAAAAGCRVTGTYVLDNAKATLTLKVDGGAVQTLAVGSIATSASASAASAASSASAATPGASTCSSGGSLVSTSRGRTFGISINDGDDDDDAGSGNGELVTDDNNADLYIPQQGDPSNTGGAIGPANGGSTTSSDDANDMASTSGTSAGAGADGGSSGGLVSAAGPLVYPIATGLTLQDAAYHQVQDADGGAALYCASADTASLDCGAQDATEVASDDSGDDGDDGDSSLSSLAPLRGKIRHADGAKSSCTCAKNRTYNLQVTAKAFIASLGTDVGNPGDPYYKVPFLAAAVATAAYYHEAPSEMAGCASGPPATFDTCRLKATTNLIATCAGTRLVSLTSSMTDEEGGDEGPFFHGAVAKAFAKASVQTSNGRSNGSFGLLVYGHPPLSLEPGFQVVKTRPQVDIWNHTTGSVQCTANGISVTVASGGSKFPSMASWVSRVDGGRHDVLSFHTRVQGNFGDLWSLEPVPTGP